MGVWNVKRKSCQAAELALEGLLASVKGHYESAWFIDHLEGLVLEGWMALTYLSALHSELLWGHSVLCQSFRNPALLSKMTATLHTSVGWSVYYQQHAVERE